MQPAVIKRKTVPQSRKTASCIPMRPSHKKAFSGRVGSVAAEKIEGNAPIVGADDKVDKSHMVKKSQHTLDMQIYQTT